VIAHALAERLGRRVPYVLLLGASGEAFRLSYDREAPAGRLSAPGPPVNTFLAALALSGLEARATHGGPFEPALGGVETEVGKGLAVVLGSRTGPAILAGVNRKDGDVERVHSRGEPARIPLEDFREQWEQACWMGGPAPFLRITVEKGAAPRPLDDMSRVGLETLVTLLSDDAPGRGLSAWEAWAKDLLDDAVTGEQAQALYGGLLPALAAGRLAGARFLQSIARAIPPESRGPVEAAARCYREIHNPDLTGEPWGTGLLPEVAQCVLTEDRPDPEKLGDPALRERAAKLLTEIRACEARALEHVLALPTPLRTL
jgi:hypothetical protein